MTDTPTLGGNAAADLKRRIDRRVRLLDEVAELQEELKGFKAEDKSDGYNEKAIANAVKMRRADAETVLATLLLEAEIDVYRRAAGVPTDIETAQGLAHEAAESLPEPKERKRRRDGDDIEEALSSPALDGTAVSVDGGATYHELGSARRRKREDLQ